MDKHLESSWRLVYYQVSGEPGIALCSRRSDILTRAVWTCAQAYSLIILFFACLIFAVGLDCKITLTAKFSRFTVDSKYITLQHEV